MTFRAKRFEFPDGIKKAERGVFKNSFIGKVYTWYGQHWNVYDRLAGDETTGLLRAETGGSEIAVVVGAGIRGLPTGEVLVGVVTKSDGRFKKEWVITTLDDGWTTRTARNWRNFIETARTSKEKPSQQPDTAIMSRLCFKARSLCNVAKVLKEAGFTQGLYATSVITAYARNTNRTLYLLVHQGLFEEVINDEHTGVQMGSLAEAMDKIEGLNILCLADYDFVDFNTGVGSGEVTDEKPVNPHDDKKILELHKACGPRFGLHFYTSKTAATSERKEKWYASVSITRMIIEVYIGLCLRSLKHKTDRLPILTSGETTDILNYLETGGDSKLMSTFDLDTRFKWKGNFPELSKAKKYLKEVALIGSNAIYAKYVIPGGKKVAFETIRSQLKPIKQQATVIGTYLILPEDGDVFHVLHIKLTGLMPDAYLPSVPRVDLYTYKRKSTKQEGDYDALTEVEKINFIEEFSAIGKSAASSFLRSTGVAVPESSYQPSQSSRSRAPSIWTGTHGGQGLSIYNPGGEAATGASVFNDKTRAPDSEDEEGEPQRKAPVRKRGRGRGEVEEGTMAAFMKTVKSVPMEYYLACPVEKRKEPATTTHVAWLKASLTPEALKDFERVYASKIGYTHHAIQRIEQSVPASLALKAMYLTFAEKKKVFNKTALDNLEKLKDMPDATVYQYKEFTAENVFKKTGYYPYKFSQT